MFAELGGQPGGYLDPIEKVAEILRPSFDQLGFVHSVPQRFSLVGSGRVAEPRSIDARRGGSRRTRARSPRHPADPRADLEERAALGGRSTTLGSAAARRALGRSVTWSPRGGTAALGLSPLGSRVPWLPGQARSLVAGVSREFLVDVLVLGLLAWTMRLFVHSLFSRLVVGQGPAAGEIRSGGRQLPASCVAVSYPPGGAENRAGPKVRAQASVSLQPSGPHGEPHRPPTTDRASCHCLPISKYLVP